MRRQIVEIDRDRCNGCGQCIPGCAEGALRIVGGKAVLASDAACDGLGACLGQCPQDAIRIVERDAPAFDQAAADAPAAAAHRQEAKPHACPGERIAQRRAAPPAPGGATGASQLTHWPVQLHLVPAAAPFFQGADLLIAASCVPFAYAGFHPALLAGKALVIACPKLDRTEPYLEKLTAIFTQNDIRSVTVAVMEVPCCQGLVKLVRQALHDSGKKMPITVEVIGVNGERK
ncbi:MAG TPA: 4Fe-4S dicluster domain-containing protein [Candidatus Edwardsbacteria bacterium]|nr:4Fe-4S dicluster domain-containing protein [Candidatus Edwardsbacteria bacterium]